MDESTKPQGVAVRESLPDPDATLLEHTKDERDPSANAATSGVISREAADQHRQSQTRQTMSLTAMVESMDIEERRDHVGGVGDQRQREEEIINATQQTGHQRSSEADSEPMVSTVNAATDTNTAMLNQQTNLNGRQSPSTKELATVASASPADPGAGSNNNRNYSALDNSKPGPQPPPPQQQQQQQPQQQPPSTAKLNGLKNRQRPPPLVLDKVSNFYDNETNSSIQPAQQHQPQHLRQRNQSKATATQPNSISNNLATNKPEYMQQNAKNYQSKQATNPHPSDDSSTRYDQTISSNIINNNNNINNSNYMINNNANHKFWASLNENASRNKALANARSTSATTTLNELSDVNVRNPGGGSEALGPDLIIKQRNSSGSISSSRVVSTLSARKQRFNQNNNAYHPIGESLIGQQQPPKSNQQKESQSHDYQDLNKHQNQQSKEQLGGVPDPSGDPINDSNELDECLLNAESNGGNLVGVENITPPASGPLVQDQYRTDEPPASATSSRPRSNNPFLDENDDEFEEYRNGILSDSANRDSFSSQNNNFHTRPASFIAATDRVTGFAKPSSDFAAKQRIVEEKLADIQLNNDRSVNAFPPDSLNQHQQQIIQAPSDQLDSQASVQQRQQVEAHNQFMVAQYHGTTNDMIYGSNQFASMAAEPTISIDSESAVCQPPPSATMQLPHWSDAIYELKNAILEKSSIAGGAENGQFIHIVESGDVILEFDQIKVSGLTLLEFNELVEAKQFHLLKAIQTKHSHGLTVNLRDYLAISFPKGSEDKKLQGVIRDNIYKRTIPCTTRLAKSGEVDGVDYHFLTKDQFVELNRQGALLECGVYVGHFYGTLKPLCDLNQLMSNLSLNPKDETYVRMRRPWDASHPTVEMILRKDATFSESRNNANNEHPLYENHESLRMSQPTAHDDIYMPNVRGNNLASEAPMNEVTDHHAVAKTVPEQLPHEKEEALPPGWERVSDQTHGTYYIDHNTQRTQYERPYEVELTKGSMGFGFTLVEADSGLLLVRSVIPGGPAHMNGTIRPGDILISAVGVSVTGLQHTDIARLFSTFAVGDRVRLTFARSNYVLDENIIPDEYLFSNGTNGDLAIAVNPNNPQFNNQDMAQNPHILVNQEFDFIKVTLKRGEQGFGFTISDSIAGQKVRKIQNHEICSNLKQGDILINLNGVDITKMTHKEVVECLKKCPPGDDVTLTIKRKKRFRSKTPMAMHTDVSEAYSLDSTPQRNCKTPSLDGLMLKHPANYNSKELPVAPTNLFQPLNQEAQLFQPVQEALPQVADANLAANGLPVGIQTNAPLDASLYGSLGPKFVAPPPQPVYGENLTSYQQMDQPMIQTSIQTNDLTQAPFNLRPNSNQSSDPMGSLTNSVQASEPPMSQLSTYHTNLRNDEMNQVNQYNNFMNNDKLMMMQMQQLRYQQPHIYSSDYHQVPLYSNSEVMNGEFVPSQHQMGPVPALPIKPPMNQHHQYHNQQQYLHPSGLHLPAGSNDDYQNNFYANNEEIALQSGVQYGYLPAPTEQFTFMRPISHGTPHDEHDEFEYHDVDLERENTASNWGIRLIGGAEVDRAISIGSMIHDGVAAKSGKLKSGDEIISIDGVNVIGATHKHVVDLISARTKRVSLVVRRKTFAEACDVVLTKNVDEGFGFVIISNENCVLIGKIIEGSPADRCKQLRVRDCIIAVNGHYITPDMKHPEIVNMIKDCGSTLRLRIIPVDCYTVKLIKDVQNDSFGFRMRGGSEYDGTPLYIVRVEPNGQAHGLLNVGDQILEINNIPTVGMTHQQAATIIKYSDPIVKLKLRRNFVTPPSLLVDSPRSLQKYNQTAEMKQVTLASTPTNFPSSHDTSFSSLPPNVNMMGQKMPQQLSIINYI